MFEYTVSARLRAVTSFEEAHFLRHLQAVARRLERYAPSIKGTPGRYEVAVRLTAESEAEAEKRWWKEVEPALERESLGSLTAVYTQLPKAVYVTENVKSARS